jgi:hypothetical protein
MWLRNLLFIGLLSGGVVALGANLMPPREPKPVTRYDAAAYQADDFRAVVAKIDDSFRQEWAAAKATPAPPAPDLAVMRRLALALVGTVPSLEEIRQFEYLPPEERLAWWIDHLLQDRRFADYFAERVARAAVGTEGGPFIFFRRRRLVSWLGDEIHQARPYDELVRDLITTRGLWTDKPATNFVSVTRQEKDNQPDPIRLAGRVTRAFLGLRLDCAECHNHPYAQWKQSDFQGLAAFFGQTHIGFTGIYDGDGEFMATDKKTQEKSAVPPRVPFAAELLPEDGTRRERLAAWVTHKKNPYFARAAVNRVWALLLGRPLVDPVDNLEVEVPVPGAHQILADDFAANDFDLRRLIRLIASAQVYRLDSAADRDLTEEDERVWAAFPLTRLRPEQVAGSVTQASSITTIDAQSHIVQRLIRFGDQNDFVQRYGDSGEDEFGGRGGTIPQRLLMMNGKLQGERVKAGPFTATGRIAALAPDDPKAVETAYLCVLTRRPTAEEAAHFERSLKDKDFQRAQHIEDLYWALINSTEFSWNH